LTGSKRKTTETMNLPLKPIYLLADSRLLFQRDETGLFLDDVRRVTEGDDLKAAYIGASNGDQPEFYDLFLAAMEGIGIEDCRAISASFSPADAAFLDRADIILLAGGSVQRGWDVFEQSGMKDVIVRRYFEGALLMGVSAGAVQLGLRAWREGARSSAQLFETFMLVPFLISTHEEKDEWESLVAALELFGPNARGIGIPAGGGMIYHADGSVEPVLYPLHQFSAEEGRIVRSLLLPASASDVIGAPSVH
jgi:cyanophycinase